MGAPEGADPVTQLVVVGASAGGIDALSTLVAGLPSEFPAAIVIAQHLDPRRPSHLADILTRRSALTVRVVEEPAELRAGVVYVAPANRHVEIADHHVVTTPPTDARPRPSVDHLLESAAAAYGESVIAVILTGAGSDGTAGARYVKAGGGTVIIQNPETASFPSMPASLSPSTVDIVANLDAIPGLLMELLSLGGGNDEPEDERTLTLLLTQLREESGIDFSAYKPGTLRRRLQRRIAATGVASLSDYVRMLQDNPDEYRRLVSTFLIKVTEFFRDPELFQALRERVIPELIAEARTRDRELRIWSAGCATGEEAYSIAILIAEALGQELGSWQVRVFATDLDPDAIASARRGAYPAAALQDVPPELVTRYFRAHERGFVVDKGIRSMIVFGDHDLGQRAPFPRIDLALCRNVLIYFTTDLQRRALHLFAFSLRDGGYLVLGKAESVTPFASSFVLEDSRLKLYRRQGPRVVLPPINTSPLQAVPGPTERRRPPLITPQTVVTPTRPGQRAESLLLALPIGVVVVDRDYDIQSINTRARELLRIHGRADERDLIHLTRPLQLDALRDALDRALAGRRTEFTARLESGRLGVGRDIRVEVYPSPETGEAAGMAVVLIHEPVAEEGPPDPPDPDAAELLPGKARELLDENRELYSDNAELTTANALLRSENEALLVSSEEAQAATEEVETLNEELQATNEELETLNEELQATVEELNTTNEDMSARSQELQDLGVTLAEQHVLTEEGRARLATVISAMRDAVVVVDPGGNEILHNTAYEVLTSQADVLAGGSEADHAVDGGLRDRAARGETFTFQFQRPNLSGERRWYEVVGQPVPDADREPAGGVLVIRDITDRSLAQLQEEFVAVVAHELRTPLTALRGYVQLIQGGRSTGDAAGHASRYGTHALEQIDRLTAIVADLVDAARIQTGRLHLERRRVNLSEVAAEGVAIATASLDGRTIRVATGDELWVLADPGRLQQVVLNLLNNALLYAPADRPIDVRVYAENGSAVLEVEDYGPGIPPEQLRTLFKRERVDPRGAGGGLGLGLYISHEIVEALGGSLTARSMTGIGTSMTVRLPFVVPIHTAVSVSATAD